MSIDYDALDALARKLMARRKAHPMRETGFIYKHGKRVARSVILLRERLFPEDALHDDALRIAAMFHDIGKGIEPHNVSGEALVRAMLAGLVPETLLQDVARLIAAHTRHDGPHTPDEMLLMDADVLDHFGAVEIALSAQYGAYDEKGVETMLEWYQEQYPPYCARTRERLHFDLTKAIFDEKAAYAQAYAERLAREAAGEYMV